MARPQRPVHFTHYDGAPSPTWPWRNFTARELASPDDGTVIVDPDALDALQRLRDRWGAPIVLGSAYRSAAHNRAVGGVETSQHRVGRAFDVRIGATEDRERLIAIALASGFHGVGLYPGFVHLDTRAPGPGGVGAFWDAR